MPGRAEAPRSTNIGWSSRSRRASVSVSVGAVRVASMEPVNRITEGAGGSNQGPPSAAEREPRCRRARRRLERERARRVGGEVEGEDDPGASGRTEEADDRIPIDRRGPDRFPRVADDHVRAEREEKTGALRVRR